MSGKLRAIKKRISSVKNTQQITRAMYMVSAAKLRRAQEAAESSRPYAEALEETISDLVAKIEGADHPLLVPREEREKAELILFTSDRGLCGGFNANLIRRAEAFFKEEGASYKSIELTTVGRKGKDYFKRRGWAMRRDVMNLVREINFNLAAELADDVTERYLAGEVDAVFILFPVFKSAMSQIPTLAQLLPFRVETEEKESEAGVDYIYEPGAKELLDVLLPRQVRTQVYRAMLESVASEHGARMTAMDSATSNADEMIETLTRRYNRARQEAITTELMDIIGGKEALEG